MRISIILEDQDISGPTDTALRFINKKNANNLTPLQIALSLKNRNIKNALILIGGGADIGTR